MYGRVRFPSSLSCCALPPKEIKVRDRTLVICPHCGEVELKVVYSEKSFWTGACISCLKHDEDWTLGEREDIELQIRMHERDLTINGICHPPQELP